MRIAFISFELPPDTGGGGIGTYIRQAAAMLTELGHQVHVFAGGYDASRCENEYQELGYRVTRVFYRGHEEFRSDVADRFFQAHFQEPFDVVESADWRGDAVEIKRRAPNLPLVVKLHTCTELISRLNSNPITILQRLRRILGAWLRGNLVPPRYSRNDDTEFLQFSVADEIAAPCRAVVKLTSTIWPVDQSKISIVPYPYVPAQQLLDVRSPKSPVILYLGRIEPRKGVLELARAIPTVLRAMPAVKFLFVGKPVQSPDPELNMTQYLERQLVGFSDNVEFRCAVPPDKLAELFAEVTTCVFPSRWENFPLVCLEAMAAGKCIVGSENGGMYEQLDQGRVGILTKPTPAEIARNLIHVLTSPALSEKLGALARNRVTETYAPRTIASLQIQSYSRAIDRCSSS